MAKQAISHDSLLHQYYYRSRPYQAPFSILVEQQDVALGLMDKIYIVCRVAHTTTGDAIRCTAFNPASTAAGQTPSLPDRSL